MKRDNQKGSEFAKQKKKGRNCKIAAEGQDHLYKTVLLIEEESLTNDLMKEFNLFLTTTQIFMSLN